LSPIEYLLTECRAILLYVRMFFFPLGQNADWDFPISRSLFDHGAFLALLAIVVGIVLILRQKPLVRYGGLLFLAFLAPTSSLVPLADPVSEHRMYLPIVGLAIAVSAVIACSRVSIQRFAVASVVCSVLAFFATEQRSQVWSNGIAFWQDVVKKSPRKARGYPHLTHAYVASGKCQQAIDHLQSVRQVMPRDYFILVNWAQAYTCANRPDAALEKLQEAANVIPTADVYGMIGGILAQQGRSGEAEQAFTKALAKEPPGTDLAFVYQGNLALLANNSAAADEAYRKALSVNPYSPEALSQLRRLHEAAAREERSRSNAQGDVDSWRLRVPGQFPDRRMP
jgi:Flp pilus assembly protein TadD